ncbi:ribonuclease D [Microbacterium arborescens]|nr:ribonuclease D [Microbacterium arborescens]
MAEYTVIADDAGLERAAELLAAGDGPVAVDVERASGFRYSQRAYLIQVFRRGAGVHLFDPPAITTFAPLQAAIGDVEWVLHAASQDLPSLREAGLDPTSIFDTELAARLLGHARVGLGAVVEDTLGIVLAKAHSAADWSTRPLPQSWLEYAALDVEHLIDVRDVLARELEAQGKVEFAAQEFQAVLDRPVKPPREDPWRRLSGLHTIRGRRALAVARALWTARARSTPVSRTSPPAGSSPTARSSRRSPPTPRRSRIWRRSRTSPAARAARSSTAGGRPSRPGGLSSRCRRTGCRATACRRCGPGSTATLPPTPA